MKPKQFWDTALRLYEPVKVAASRISARAAITVLGAAAVLVAGVLFYLRPPASLEEPPEAVIFFQIGTGSAGDDYFAVGERLAAAISRPPGTPRCERGMPCGVAGLVAVARSSAGPVANVRAVSAGLFDSALVAAPVLELAAQAETPFKGEKPIRNLRAIAGVYREALYLVASRNANIGSVADLRDMRVSVGPAGSGTREAALPVLAVHSLGRRTVQLSEYDTATAIDLTLRGQLDAFFLVDALPSAEIASLADRGSINIVPIDGEEVQQLTHPGESFQPLEIPDDLYRFVPATRTLGVSMVWVVNEQADPDIVYKITEALFFPGNRVLLSGPALPGLLPGDEKEREKFAISSIPVPLHEGAERYYRQQGLIADGAP
ncbi:MAG: TAXI family TRAP transporter solute-binding subunit [Parvibaculum sp.]|uniref:TAXI family TRAP transporter solute-binding subunit n=1 Tax=Parvibaculum sp. TaxID=2024848 RepID=UPI00272F7582|nr:TAXI family TRAP transporter solute-binding subunit [Parvibaculum sp.]MDP1626325.1 TAXI family TRAP transporter solute-binding subunit [Parvibaculum sp.]MDP2151284.1 TAXI family TRAP transporter solute-binding subunit [Parvibaculum sp.]MDP3327125.1 TAXI family TRAP transporter solute-binding subunit [Parvibaculum sp.]